MFMLTDKQMESTADYVDQEWVNLMREAKKLGFDREQVKEFLDSKTNNEKQRTKKNESRLQKEAGALVQPIPFLQSAMVSFTILP
ncbi:hypothetical protein N780_09500 [Pontibacillus chungwhensis BH030062]|uniref:Sin domain-containing protein n=1 Tax=Pontibacillus chungwhensis BH030062 TaxID=1385513 RepID=A0A0A2UTR4_9BACI|nr:anti-repressor SinI family protein [Pontibacillus chungwhensis]KGP89851.1 hypothetical protein N780_09500 [Pontibacillus chungwhensis BH030062]